MPTYKFLDNNTGREWEEFMGITECDNFLIANKNITQLVNGFPASVSSAMGGTTKPDQGFRDLLKRIKKKHSGGFKRADINTW